MIVKVIFLCFDLPLNKQPHKWLWRKKDIAKLPQSALYKGRWYWYVIYRTEWIRYKNSS